jgi:hypothetical protein
VTRLPLPLNIVLDARDPFPRPPERLIKAKAIAMTRTIRPHFLSSLPVDLQADAFADWSERAAILQWDAGLTRDESEIEAARWCAPKWRAIAEKKREP